MLRLLLLIVLGFGMTVKAAETRPNILYCLADDWAYPHAGAYGDKVVRTPNFDRIAREGMLFTHAFSAAPSCTPSRAAMLTGRYPHQLEEGSVLWGFLPKKFPVYPNLLEEAGYKIGSTRKGWGPGNFQDGGYTHNPAGPSFKSFAAFLEKVPKDKPFCFWFGSQDPHRPYEKGAGAASGLKPDQVTVPPYWPDNDTTRNDILDYYSEVERFDRDVGEMLQLLEKSGQLDNTIVVISGDNGSPFPRCKANLYDGGTRQPLAIRWPKKIKPNQKSDAFINLNQLAPTFLEAASLNPNALARTGASPVPLGAPPNGSAPAVTSRSFLPLLTNPKNDKPANDAIYLERERHANVRPNKQGYPARAIRTRDFLYIRNFRPDRWPAGDPVAFSDPPRPFGDCDDGPTKLYMLDHRDEPAIAPLFNLAFGKRPAEELYDLHNDPHQLTNIATSAHHTQIKKDLRSRLDQWMQETADPRAQSDDDHWDQYPYYGGRQRPGTAGILPASPTPPPK